MAAAKKKGGKQTEWELPHLMGKTFAFSGKLSRHIKVVLVKLIETEGGTVVNDITADLNYLIVGIGDSRGSGPSGAEKKAALLNNKGKAAVQILDEVGFRQLFVRDRDTAITLLQSGARGIKLWNDTVATHWLRLSLDVTKADFRECDLRDANLSSARLDGSDFRGAQLSGVKIGRIRDAKFDKVSGVVVIEDAKSCSFKGANFGSEDESNTSRISAVDSNFDGANIRNARVNRMKNCSHRRLDATGANLDETDISEADFKGAKLSQINSWKLRAAGARFDGVDLSKAVLLECNFRGASFRRAKLLEASVKECDFSEADLSQANLSNATAHDSNFKNANLTKANFRGAKFCDVDFRGAVLEEADFTDAIVDGAKLTDAQIRSAKGLKRKEKQRASKTAASVGQIGPNILELEKIAAQCQELAVVLRADLDANNYVELKIRAANQTAWSFYAGAESLFDAKGRQEMGTPNIKIPTYMLQAAGRWAQATPRLAEIELNLKKSPLKKKELRLLAIAAWCEAFGMEIPTEDQLNQQTAKAAEKIESIRERMIADLRTGTAGIKKWNKLTDQQRKSLGKLRRVDLSGSELQKADFKNMDFQGTDFSRADLRQANFGAADVKQAQFNGVKAEKVVLRGVKAADASFKDADLRQANLEYASLLRADFTEANLTGAGFNFSDVKGATFANANLQGTMFRGTKFDEKTVFPDDFELEEDLIWAGQGKDPRLLEKVEQLKSAGPIDFETFMEQLADNFDQSRLQKAMKMLKAESFQLFAQVEDTAVTGVVKSQTTADLVYSCRLDSEGTFACCTQNLNPCGGLRGALCKHLLVLIVGLTKGEELDPTTINAWVAASKLQGPVLDKDLMSEVFLKFKGAEAGEIDWRPTETVPEDYYAF